MCLFQMCSLKADEMVRRSPFRVALERANKRGDSPETAAWGGGHLPLLPAIQCFGLAWKQA